MYGNAKDTDADHFLFHATGLFSNSATAVTVPACDTNYHRLKLMTNLWEKSVPLTWPSGDVTLQTEREYRLCHF